MDKEERRKRIKKEKIMEGRAWNYKISSSIAILWGDERRVRTGGDAGKEGRKGR